jgi:CAAX protease family protein
MSAVIRRHPLVAFFVLALAITWGPTPFGIFMAAGPLLAAIVITALVDGRLGLRELGSRMLRWRVGWRWYAAAILTPLAVVFGTGGLNAALGAPGSVIRDLSISSAVLLFALRLVIPVFSPIGEEPGWRGFALPRLLAERSPFEATLFLGLIVALWHVPLIFIASEDLPPIFLLTTVAVTFFYTWLFIHTDGSVFITIVAHATEGLIGRELTGDDGWTGADETHWILLYTAGWCAVALALLVFDWKLWRTRLPSASPAVRSQPVRISDSTSVSLDRPEAAT